jgi:hypothetical protein
MIEHRGEPCAGSLPPAACVANRWTVAALFSFLRSDSLVAIVFLFGLAPSTRRCVTTPQLRTRELASRVLCRKLRSWS